MENRTMLPRRRFLRNSALALGAGALAHRLAWGQAAGATQARQTGSRLTLENGILAAEWDLTAGVRLTRLLDKRGHAVLADAPAPVFALVFADGTVDSSMLAPVGGAVSEAYQVREIPGGWRWSAQLRDVGRQMEVGWRAQLGLNDGYLRQEITIRAAGPALSLQEVVLLDLPASGGLSGAQVVGRVKGSPVTAGNWFLGFEHPLASQTVEHGRVRGSLKRPLPLPAGQAVTYSAVIGAAAPGQMRREFLRYIENERAHPYRPFLHYNSWYDLGYFTPYDEAGALGVIQAFGEELHRKRGVKLDSFLFDDGWDDHQLWGFNSGFPHGFTPLQQAAASAGAAPGIWLSPWGGYGKPRTERLDYGKAHGFETNRSGFALSGPVYYQRFREVCLEFVNRYGINQFKIDGTGSSATVVPGSAFGSDFEAAIALIGDLRAAKPDLFINLTTGTYPSPFWLRYADSTWRGGEDNDFAGVGTNRQQWITYRDAQTYKNVVRQGPLYPLNSLMLHGIIYAKDAEKLNTDPGGDFDAEVRAYFGTGTQLQEMYVSHALLDSHAWDKLAESARWARRCAGALLDSHWVGGDPGMLEPYGHAGWSPRQAVLTLRNPSDQPRTLELDPASAFELPSGASGTMTLRPAYKEDQWRQKQDATPVKLKAGVSHGFALKPFQVLTLESELSGGR